MMSFFGRGGLFGDSGEVLFFIILFLLLFYNCGFGVGRGYGVCSESTAEE